MPLQVPDPRLGRATFGDLVSLTSAVVQENFLPFLLAGMLYQVPAAVVGAKVAQELFSLGSRDGGFQTILDYPLASYTPLGTLVVLAAILWVLIVPVIDAVFVQKTLENLSGTDRPLPDISDNIRWRPVIGLDIFRISAQLLSVTSVMAVAGILFVPFFTTGERMTGVAALLVVLFGILVTGVATLFVMLYVPSRFFLAKACYLMGRGTVTESLGESWKLTGGSTGGSFFGIHWVRILLLHLVILAVIFGLNVAVSIPAQMFLSSSGDDLFPQVGYFNHLAAALMAAPAQAIGQMLGGVSEAVYFADLAERHRPSPVGAPAVVSEEIPPDGMVPPADPGSIPMA